MGWLLGTRSWLLVHTEDEQKGGPALGVCLLAQRAVTGGKLWRLHAPSDGGHGVRPSGRAFELVVLAAPTSCGKRARRSVETAC